jgi:TDG/mug DNA glycosylase family protein
VVIEVVEHRIADLTRDLGAARPVEIRYRVTTFVAVEGWKVGPDGFYSSDCQWHSCYDFLMTFRKPTPEELKRAYGRSIPDLIGPNLRILFCGINPGLYSGATGLHFARPGNRFWPALHAAGFTKRLLAPWENRELLEAGYGVTNIVRRTTPTAAELSDDEFRAGRAALARKVRKYSPRWVAVLGLGAYRTGFASPKATVGRQLERIGTAGLWVLPNPSGLNANYQLAQLAAMLGELRVASDAS